MEDNEYGTNFEAYFLGPRGENAEFYMELLRDAFTDHIHWREAFHLDDSCYFITDEDKKSPSFKRSQAKIEQTLIKLRELLKKNQPFFSPRYIGHMNWEIMAAPIIAYFATALYNPNNVAKAGSTGTSELEIEVGMDFVNLFGFDQEKAWGHICTGGTIANMEALWIARNMKVVPLVLKQLLMKYKIKETEYTTGNTNVDFTILKKRDLLRNFNPIEIINLQEAVLKQIKKTHDDNEHIIDDEFDKLTIQQKGVICDEFKNDPGLVFVPETKHYSFKKTMDLIGLGQDQIRYVPVDHRFKMDIDKLKEMIFEEAYNHPILAVIGVAGSTEESSVDEIDKIIEIRNELKEKRGMGFHIHVDAAYGGYVRSLFLNEDNQFMDKDELKDNLKKMGIIGDKEERKYVSWPHDDVYRAYQAISQVDTITVDPHKLGYVLYPAGGIALRDKRMRNYIQCYAPYVFPKPKGNQPDALIGSYILEGSKPGAAAAAVWTAHRIMPLNITGYGKLIGETIDGAQALWYGLNNAEVFSVAGDIEIKVYPIAKPDINIVNYVFNFVGNKNLQKMNRLTKYIAQKILGPIPEAGKTMLSKRYIVSDTSFTFQEYKNSPFHFLKGMGFSEKEWDEIKELEVIRSVIMSPYLTTDYVDENYVTDYINYLGDQLSENSEEIKSILENS